MVILHAKQTGMIFMDHNTSYDHEVEHDSNANDLDSLGLSVQAFSMEFDDGANHCSILCNRTSNPAPRPRSTAISDTKILCNRTCNPVTPSSSAIGDIKMTAVGICSADKSLEYCGSPSSYLMLWCSETACFSDVDFHTAKCGLWKSSRSKSVIHRLIQPQSELESAVPKLYHHQLKY